MNACSAFLKIAG